MLIVLLAFVTTLGSTPGACSVKELFDNPEGYHWPLDRIRSFVDSADIIVRARADRSSGDSGAVAARGRGGEVHFAVLEIIRGSPPADLRISGYFVDRDDFNDTAVPYLMVRRSGQSGSCFTREYRRGGEYLLLLKRAPHVLPPIAEATGIILSPYWAPLAPLNEQVQGAQDPWCSG